MPLEIETETYKRERARLLLEGNEGKYVVIKGENVLGTYCTLGDALRAGYDRYNLEEFLCKKVQEHERPLHFSMRVR